MLELEINIFKKLFLIFKNSMFVKLNSFKIEIITHIYQKDLFCFALYFTNKKLMYSNIALSDVLDTKLRLKTNLS